MTRKHGNVDTAVKGREVEVTRTEEKEEFGDFRRHEISHGEFHRTIALPETVDADRAKAKFENGMLEVIAPKTEPAKRRTVKVE